jgi:hypothetical protein
MNPHPMTELENPWLQGNVTSFSASSIACLHMYSAAYSDSLYMCIQAQLQHYTFYKLVSLSGTTLLKNKTV